MAAARELPRQGPDVALDAPEMRREPGRHLRDAHAATSEDPAPRGDVSPGVGPRADESLFPDDRARVDRRVNPDLHVVPHDDSELAQSGVDLDAAKHDPDRRL